MSTDLAVRRSFDLTRAPDEQWNEEMVKLVASQVLRGKSVNKGELYYCLSVAEGLNLNPFIGEVYFIPGKGRDGQGPRLQAYVGRNGLVKKAAERDAYFESDTVCENDKFRMARKQDGTTVVTHSYGSQDRGEIVGAYAFLHFRNGDKPAFFYAELSQYLPTFDQDWKMNASPWGNQRSAMIEKCAMIGAGRKRLDLGNVLGDGEIESVQAQQSLAPPPSTPVEFDWEQIEDLEVRERLRAAVTRINEFDPLSWPAAKLEMVLGGRTTVALTEIATRLEQEADLVAERAQGDAGGAASTPEGDGLDGAPAPGESITDAQVVDEEHLEALKHRRERLEAELERVGGASPEGIEIMAELDAIESERVAIEDPNQGKLV